MNGGDLAAKLEAVVAKKIGRPGSLHALEQLTGGANRSTLAFEAEIDDRRVPLIVQLGVETPDPVAGIAPELKPAQQAHLMIEAAKVGVPAPPVRAILEPADGLGEGYITERIPGETLGPRILRDAKYHAAHRVMARQCGEILGRLHGLEPARVPFLVSQNPAEHLTAHRAIIDRYDFRHPALELAYRWLAEHLPAKPRHTVVHGDFRMGNMIVGEDGIRCILDWELAQTGDPMADLGWLCVRTWRFGGKNPVGGFGAREDLFAAYERTSGIAVDPAQVRYWEAFGNFKWAIHCLRLGSRGVLNNDLERCAIGRRIEEPLWDFFELVESTN
ncbi:MAG TPA: phosphotransferase family protein [Candidatus Binataceae bacterium]|nr:phosphotransferase family protein [Candidatus Binataceae bacterium]